MARVSQSLVVGILLAQLCWVLAKQYPSAARDHVQSAYGTQDTIIADPLIDNSVNDQLQLDNTERDMLLSLVDVGDINTPGVVEENPFLTEQQDIERKILEEWSVDPSNEIENTFPRSDVSELISPDVFINEATTEELVARSDDHFMREMDSLTLNPDASGSVKRKRGYDSDDSSPPSYQRRRR